MQKTKYYFRNQWMVCECLEDVLLKCMCMGFTLDKSGTYRVGSCTKEASGKKAVAANRSSEH